MVGCVHICMSVCVTETETERDRERKRDCNYFAEKKPFR